MRLGLKPGTSRAIDTTAKCRGQANVIDDLELARPEEQPRSLADPFARLFERSPICVTPMDRGNLHKPGVIFWIPPVYGPQSSHRRLLSSTISTWH